MLGKIGMGELLLILSIVLIIFGPSKLPALANLTNLQKMTHKSLQKSNN